MKKYNKKIILAFLSLFITIGFIGSAKVNAATTPPFSASLTYAILSSTYTNPSPGVTVTGSIGFTTPPAVVPAGVHANYGSSAPYSAAGTDQGTILSALNAQPCTFTFPDTAINLSTDVSHGTIGVYTPGVYCTRATRAASIGTAGITLNGAGTYIFRIRGALTTVMNSVVTLSGSSACDVFWTPSEATTLGANSVFKGNNIDAAGITLGSNVNWVGRALSFGGTVTTATNDIIAAPNCTVPTPPTPPAPPANNSQGGIYSMPWVTPIIKVIKIPTPQILPNGPGSVTYNYTVTNPGTIELSNVTLTDDKCSNIVFVSGDTNNNSKLETSELWNYKCTMYLSQTTTNIATVTGFADYVTAKDTASAVVNVILPVILTPTPSIPIVSTSTSVVPAFPETGFAPEQTNFSEKILAALSIILVIFIAITKNSTRKQSF